MSAHEATQNRGMFLTIINDFLRTGAYEEDFLHAYAYDEKWVFGSMHAFAGDENRDVESRRTSANTEKLKWVFWICARTRIVRKTN